MSKISPNILYMIFLNLKETVDQHSTYFQAPSFIPIYNLVPTIVCVFGNDLVFSVQVCCHTKIRNLNGSYTTKASQQYSKGYKF